MATIEAELLNYQSRGDFILFSAKRRGAGGRPPRRPNIGRPSISPEPPDKGGFKLGRRPLIISGTVVAVGTVVTAVIRPWEQFTQSETEQQAGPDTLESLIAQAKKMEDGYKGQDISDKTTREKYVDILAGIFAFHNPDIYTRQQLKEAVSFEDTLRGFVQQRITSSGRTGTPTARQLENDRFTTASTDNRKKKITVNAVSEGFKQENLKTIKDAPAGWNPLKELRVVLFHEFDHLVEESEDPIIFSIFDPTNKIRERRIEGFRIIGVDEKGNFATGFDDLHEAVIELLAKDISLSDFGSYLSERDTSITGEEITALIGRLETILQLTGITHEELSRLHKKSTLRQFLLILSDKAGMNQGAPLENRIRFGSIIAGAIERNDQRTLQSYINQVKQLQEQR